MPGLFNVSKFYSLFQNFRPVQIESICRQQFKCLSKVEICFGKGRKHCWKRRKCWLPPFSPVLTMFSKGLLLRVVKSRDCVARVNPLPDYNFILFNLKEIAN